MNWSLLFYSLYFMMFLGFVVMIVGVKIHLKQKIIGLILAYGGGIFSMGSACIIIFWNKLFPHEYQELYQKEIRIQSIGYKFLGQEVAKRHQGKKMILITYSDPFEEKGNSSADFKSTVSPGYLSINRLKRDAFLEGINNQVHIIKELKVSSMNDLVMEYYLPRTPPPPTRSNNPIYNTRFFDSIVETYPDCDLIVSLAGLPPNYQEMKYWEYVEQHGRPKLILSETSLMELKKVIVKGYIDLLLCNNFTISKEATLNSLPNNDTEIFHQRFFLLDAHNIETVEEKCPYLFGNTP